uniref:Secreted protein n=1 Tax=Panagrellus redivivus TaxID=6233 RepID=A0A7E4UMX6_PANRE
MFWPLPCRFEISAVSTFRFPQVLNSVSTWTSSTILSTHTLGDVCHWHFFTALFKVISPRLLDLKFLTFN